MQEHKENIVLSAWEMVTEFPSLKKLNFIPSLTGMLWLLVILMYQLTFTYITIFDKKDEAIEVLTQFFHTDYSGETIIALVVLFILYMFLEPVSTGGMIEMMHSYREKHGKENRHSWQGFFDGMGHFLPLFELHNLTAIFRPLSIITFYILLLRVFGVAYAVPVSVVMGLYLVFAFIINMCFSYANFFVIFEHKSATQALSASTGLTVRNIAITGRLYFTMILLYLRTVIAGGIFLVLPFIISSTIAFLPIPGLKLFFLIAFLAISVVLFIFIVHLNSTLEIFLLATWYESYRLCKKNTPSHASHDDHGGHDTHGHATHTGHDDHHDTHDTHGHH